MKRDEKIENYRSLIDSIIKKVYGQGRCILTPTYIINIYICIASYKYSNEYQHNHDIEFIFLRRKFNNPFFFLNHLEIDFIKVWKLQGARIVHVFESNEQKNKYLEYFLKQNKIKQNDVFAFYGYPIFLFVFLLFYKLAKLEKLFV